MAVIHVRAILRLFGKEERGRRTPIVSGYRPQFHFTGDASGWVVAILECNPDPIPPGAEGAVGLSFLRWETVRPRLFVGSTFQIKEGYRTLGEGVITSVSVDLPENNLPSCN